jgi:hypothetical protein
LILNRLSTAVPSSDLAQFRSYTKTVSSWWAAHSSILPNLQEECPDSWENAKIDIPGGEIWLNATIALAGCSDEKKPIENVSAAAVSASVSISVSVPTPATGDASSKTKVDAVIAGLAVAMLLL